MHPERLRSDVVQIASLAAPGQRRGFKNAPSSAVITADRRLQQTPRVLAWRERAASGSWGAKGKRP